MATALRNSTPPPPSSIRTPKTPRFGLDDNYEPYSPRKSARVSQRARETQTPPPQSSGHNLRYSSQSTPRSTPRTTKRSVSTNSPSSPQTATKKLARSSPSEMSGRRVSGALDFHSTASAASALGLPTPQTQHQPKMAPRSTASVRNNGMLITPAKTPKKRPTETAPAIQAIARNLFAIHPDPDEEIMPSPKKHKGRKRYTGFSLDSFEVEEEDRPIPIYTDSNDRVPELDPTEDNPFYGEGSTVQREPVKRSSKRRKIMVPGEGEKTIEELEKREDGLIYVFRGKKMFRKFTDIELSGARAREEAEDEEADAALDEDARLFHRPMTRSSIKPRLLFPPPKPAKISESQSYNTEDEEADTDIEEQPDMTPLDQAQKMLTTPKAPRFAPASPPTTARTTRSKHVDMKADDEVEPASPSRNLRGRPAKVSPFDSWSRSKPIGGSKKRSGSPIARERASKRVRG